MNKMYGVDKYGWGYVFDIISEYSDEIIVKMTNKEFERFKKDCEHEIGKLRNKRDN